MERCSMLVVLAPDGHLHGQRLTQAEAAELCRRLLELRGEWDDDEWATAPRPRAKKPRKPKGTHGVRRPGGGRKKLVITGPELSELVALRQQGLSYDKIGRATHHGVDAVKRALAPLEGVQADVQADRAG